MKFWTQSLRIRLAGSFFLIAFVAVVLISLFTFWHARAALEQEVSERLYTIGAEKALGIEYWIDTQRQFVNFLAQAYELRTYATALVAEDTRLDRSLAYTQVDTYLESIITTHPDLLEILVLTNPGGQVVFSTNKEREGNYQVDTRYFREGRQQLFVHPVYFSPTLDQMTITIARPLANATDSNSGVIAVHLNLDRLDAIVLNRAGLGETGESYLIGQYNEVVSSGRFGNREFPRGVHTVGIHAALEGRDGVDRYLNYDDTPVLGAYQWLETERLALLTEIHQTEAFAPAKRLAGTILLTGMGAASMLALLVWLLACQITRPITALTASVMRITADNLAEQVPVLTHDEIGVLARSFNQMTRRLQTLYADLQRSEEHFRLLIENASDIILIVDQAGSICYASPSVNTELGYPPETLLNQSLDRLVHPDDYDHLAAACTYVYHAPDTTRTKEFRLRHADDTWHTFECRSKYLPVIDHGARIVLNARDISERLVAERERAHLQQEIIHMQAARLRELSTPFIPIAEGVVLMPLIGTIDHQRSEQIIDTLLAGITHQHAHFAILDITGVPLVDTYVAQSLIRTAQSVKLLGTRIILTGIQPQTAQTLVHLGVDLSSITTYASLQGAIAYALSSMKAASAGTATNGMTTRSPKLLTRKLV